MTSSRTTLSLGIVGFGQRAQLWQHAHRPEAGSVVTAVCDTSPRGQADARAALPDADVTDDLDQLLGSGVDAVLVLTPDHLHLPVARAALQAGVAVFCEKPMATTIEDCDELLRVAHDTGTRLYVGHNMRHMPVVTQLRDLVRAGRIGTVQAIWCRHFVGHGGDFYFKDWHADRLSSTGLLLQKGAHDLDVIHWLAGGYARRVAAMGALAVYGSIQDRRDRSGERMPDWYSLDNWPPRSQTGLHPVIDVEDISMMNLALDNGVLATRLLAQLHRDRRRGPDRELRRRSRRPDRPLEPPARGPCRARRDGADHRRRLRPRWRRPADDGGVPAVRPRGRPHRHLAGRRTAGCGRGRDRDQVAPR
jgi:predicted dehydrogenase